MKNNPKRSIVKQLFRGSILTMALLQQSSTVNGLDKSTECSWSVSNTAPEITVPYDKQGETMLYTDLVKAKQTFTPSSLATDPTQVDIDACAVKYIHSFDNPLDLTPTTTLFAEYSYTIPTTPGSKQVYFEVSNSETTTSQEMIGARFILCGKEVLTPATGADQVISAVKYQDDNNRFHVIQNDSFKSWFSLQNDQSGQSTECVIQHYKLLDENKVELVDQNDPLVQLTKKYNEYIHQDLLVTLDNAVTEKVFYLQGVTTGQQTAEVKLVVSVEQSTETTDVCAFSIDPLYAETVMKYLTPEEIGAENVKKRAAGQEDQISSKQIGNVASAFSKQFTIGTTNKDVCSVDDQNVQFKVFVDKIKGAAGQPPIEHNKFIIINKNDFTKEITGPTKLTYIMEITSKMAAAEGIFSNLVQNDIVICGKEQLQLKGDTSDFVSSYTGDGTTFEAEITSAVFNEWFEIGNPENPEVSEHCKVDEYTLVVVDENPFIMLVGYCQTDAGVDGTEGSDYDTVTAATSEECQQGCVDKDTACTGYQWTFEVTETNTPAICMHWKVAIKGEGTPAGEFDCLDKYKLAGTRYKTLSKLKDVSPDYFVASKSQITGELDSAIKVNLKRGVENYKFFLQARTLGGAKAWKGLDITVEPYKCEYTVDPAKVEVVLTYDKDKVESSSQNAYDVNVYDEIVSQSLMTFTPANPAVCAIDQASTYATQTDYPATVLKKGTNPPLLKFRMDENTQVNNDLFFSVGNSENPYPSEMLEAKLIVCGMEELTTDGTAKKISVDKGSGNAEFYGDDKIKPWFIFNTGTKGSDEKCQKLTYELQEQSGFGFSRIENNNVISYDSGNLIIVYQYVTLKPQSFYLQATTEYGLKTRKQFIISIPCIYTSEKIAGVEEVVLPYVEGQQVKLDPEFKKLWNFKVQEDEGWEENCPLDLISFFQDSAAYDAKDVLWDTGRTITDGVDNAEFEMTADTFGVVEKKLKQGVNEFFFAYGGQDKDDMTSPVATAKIVVCGKEDIQPDDTAAFSIRVKKGEGTEEKIPKTDYSKWFIVTPGPESSAECGVKPNSYKLVGTDCTGNPACTAAPVTSNIIKLENDELVITIDNTSTNPFVVYLESETQGGKKGYKKIEVVETTDPCVYSILPQKIPAFAFDYEEGTTIKAMEEFQKRDFDFKAQGGAQCPIDKVYKWEAKPSSNSEPATSEGTFDSLNFQSEKGLHTFYFAIGGQNVQSKSNVATANVVVCGLETLEIQGTGKQDYLVKQDGTPTFVIEKSTYDKWIKVDSSAYYDLCTIKSWKLVDQDKNDYAGDVIAEDGNNFVIRIENVPQAGETVWLQAITKGGVKKEYEIAITLPQPCEPTVTPTDPQTVIIPFTGNYNDVNIAEQLQTVYTFAMGRQDATSEAECPIDRLYVYADASEYPSTDTQYQKAIGDFQLQLRDLEDATPTMGPNKYLFAMGSSTNLELSGPAAIEANLLVCGKESFDLVNQGDELITVRKGGDPTKNIPYTTYKEWFSFNANAPESADGCGVLDSSQYKLQHHDGAGLVDSLPLTLKDLVSIDETSGDLVVVVDQVKEDQQIVFLTATTKGGISKSKKIIIGEESCSITISPIPLPQDQVIVIPYVENDVVNYATKLQTEFTFATGDPTNCPKDKLYLYNSAAGAVIDSEGAFGDITFTMSETTKGKQTVFFAIGPLAKKITSSVSTADIIVCGKEELAPATADAQQYSLEVQKPNELIPKTTFEAWFNLQPGAESSTECGVKTYQLVDENGDPLEETDELIKFTSDKNSIEIVNANLPELARTVQLKATTQGDVIAFKKIELSSMLVCGLETVASSAGVATFEIDEDNDGAGNYFIDKSIYKDYFTVDSSEDGASPKCVVNKYELVGSADGLTPLPDYITWEAGIKIQVDKTQSQGVSVFLKATTMGGSTSDPPKEIKVSFKCGYKIEELNDDEVIVAYQENADFDPFPADNTNPFAGKFKFTTPDAVRCKMTHVFLYATEQDFNTGNPMENMPVPYESQKVTMSTATQGKLEFLFTITGGFKDSAGNYIMSNLGKATVFICGKEVITPTMKDRLRPIDLPKTNDPAAQRIIAFEDYKKWFDITAPTDQATTKCGLIPQIDIEGNTAHAGSGEMEMEYVEGQGIVIHIQKTIEKTEKDFSIIGYTMGGIASQVQKLAITTECKFSVTPEDKQTIVFPYVKGTLQDYIEEWKKIYTLNKEDQSCSFTNIFRFKNEDKYPDYPMITYGIDDPLENSMTKSDQGLETFYMAFGNQAVEKPSNLVVLDWVVCGKEELTLTQFDSVEIKAEKETAGAADDFHEILADEYQGWFTLDNSGPETSDQCTITDYQIVEKNAQDEWVPVTDSDLIVAADQPLTGPMQIKKERRVKDQKVYIRAITRGQASVVKEMSISVIIDCKFKLQAGITVDEAKVSVLPNNIGGEYNLARAILGDYTFDYNPTLCPQDMIYLFDADKETQVGTATIEEMMSSYVPGKTTYYWRTGSSQAEDNNDQRSELYTTNLAVCGFETLTLKDTDVMTINAIKAGDADEYNKVFVVKEADYISQFILGYDDPQSSEKCRIDKLEIIDEEGNIHGTDNDIQITRGAHDLVINVMIPAQQTKNVKIRSTTKGGKIAEKALTINVDPTTVATSDDCLLSIIPEDTRVAIPLNAGNNNEVAIVDYLDKSQNNGGVYEFNYGPADRKCAPKVIKWGKQVHLKDAKTVDDVLGDLKLSTAEPGQQQYYWSLGNLQQTFYSNTVATLITICGNEQVKLASEGYAAIALEGGFGTFTLPQAVLESYFTLDTSAENSDRACKIVDYQIQTPLAGITMVGSDIQITEAEADLGSGEKEVILVATTMGKVSGQKSLKIRKKGEGGNAYTAPTCIFSGQTYSASASVGKDAAEIEVGKLAVELFDFSSAGADCNMDPTEAYQVQKFSKFIGGNTKNGEPLSMTDYKASIEGAGVTDFFFKIGKSGNPTDWSDMFTLSVTVCGAGDTFETKSNIPRAFNFIYKTEDDVNGQVSSIAESDFSTYFTSSDACGADSAKWVIVKATNPESTEFEEVSGGDVQMNNGLLEVNLQSAESFNNQLFLQGTNLGGNVAQQRLQVTIKGTNNVCSYSASPSPIDIAIDYEDGEQVNVVEEMQKELTLLPKDNARCPINELVRYETPKGLIALSNFKFDATEEGPRSSIFTISEKVKYYYNVRTGGDTSFRSSNLIEASVTVCGKEKIAAIGESKAIKIKESDKVKNHVIGRDQYLTWFEIDSSDENASYKCGITTVDVEFQGKTLTVADSPLPFVNNHQEIMINIEQADPNNVVTLIATTRGGEKASIRLEITVVPIDDPFDMPCSYTVDPDVGTIVTQDQVPNGTTDEWKAAFDKVFTLSADDAKKCPITQDNSQWYQYENYKDDIGKEVILDDQFKIWNSMVADPMTLSFYYRFGDKEKADKKSNFFEVVITKCGLEEVSVVDGAPVEYTLGKNVYTEGFYIVMADDGAQGYKNWFSVDDSQSNPKCAALSYSLQKQDGAPLEGTDKVEIVNNKYLQINLATQYEETVFLVATSVGGKEAKRQLVIKSVEEGDPPPIADPAPQKPCRECAGENLSRICTDSNDPKPTGACCIQGDFNEKCVPNGDNISCSPMLLKAQAMFYTYCPMNNEEACGGKDFEAGSSTASFDMSTIAADTSSGEPQNDACTYNIKAPEKTYKEGSKVMFRLTQLKKLKVYLRTGDDPATAKSVKGRRRLNASSFDDKPLEVNKDYPVDLSKGKLNLIVVPEPGTQPGDTQLKFEYRVEGEKIPPPEPVTPPTEKPVTPAKEEGGGTNIVLIIVCGVLLVLVLVCCILYMQYRNKLNKQKQVQQDIEAKLAKANRGIEDLKKQKTTVNLKTPIDNNLSSVGQDKSHMESQGDASQKNLLAESQETPFVKKTGDGFNKDTSVGFKDGSKTKGKKADAIVYATVSHEEMTIKAFKDKLWTKCEMTLESLFRICDSSYEQAFSAAHFKEKLESLELGLSGAEINRLIGIFDEDLSGQITIYEYYSALEAYHVRSDEPSPFDDDPQSLKFIHQSAFRLVKVMRDRQIEPDELFRLIDVSGDGVIVLAELKEVLRSFGDFQQKELFAIREYFDLDGDGQIQKSEFFTQLNKGSQDYDAYVEKLQQNIDEEEEEEEEEE